MKTEIHQILKHEDIILNSSSLLQADFFMLFLIVEDGADLHMLDFNKREVMLPSSDNKTDCLDHKAQFSSLTHLPVHRK